jgi:hypothetical protein
MLRQRHIRVASVLALFLMGGTTASADCRGEVEAAIQRLDVPDRPYRSEMTAGQTYRETSEFIPPDRIRKIADSPNWIERIVANLIGEGPIETIQIGNRTWERAGKKWVEYGFAGKTLREMSPPEALPPDTTFACLSAVAFEGATYVSYQISYRPTRVLVATFGTNMSKMQEEEALKTLKEAPPTWRTILLDRETGLPAYDLITPTSQLDNPKSKTHYTYPRDLTIEPPVR